MIFIAAGWGAAAQVSVSPSIEKGKVKPMNAVNNGPERTDNKSEQMTDNFDLFSALRVPFTRVHDSSYNADYGAEHTVDISAVFPDFSADPAKPSSYDFAVTDRYLKNIQDAGSEVFFRFGQKIEHFVKKYNVYPPQDFKKWARICEHIILHYNYGWADGFQYGIRYWEIWNEPDLDNRTWAGTREQFFDLYAITAGHLKKKFPELMVGGPASCGNLAWCEAFLSEMSRRKVPIDFFSWHRYTVDPQKIAKKVRDYRQMLDTYGYTETESILNEWNYVSNWSTRYPYSLSTIVNEKGAAFVAAVMSVAQDAPIDMLMYYDARTHTVFNGLFESQSNMPLKPYYSIYAWSRLLYDYGTQVQAQSSDPELYVTAATDGKGAVGLLVSRYVEDNNVVSAKWVEIRVEGAGSGTLRAHIIDGYRTYTEIPLRMEDGVVSVSMDPQSVVFIDIPDVSWTNPVFGGWYADPEGFVDGETLWVYPTSSLPFDEQTSFDAFSTRDMLRWEKHEGILSTADAPWARRALWAPSIVKKDGRYYLFFSANDVHEGEVGGIGVAVSDRPEGPFRDLLGEPLVGRIVNGAQPIDQFVFEDPQSGGWYMYYGGWKHCNLVRLAPDFKSLVPFEDGSVFKEVTPEGYVEGPFMIFKDGKYYFMWSEGKWRKDNYCVAYAISDSPLGPFRREDTILQTDPEVGTGAGHHSVVRDIRTGDYLIVYHRHPLGDSDGNHRVVCIDRLEFTADGKISLVRMRR